MSNSLKVWPDLLPSKNSYSLSNWNSNPCAPKWYLLKPKQHCNFVLVQVPLAGYRPVTASQRCRCSCGHGCSLSCTWHMSKTWALQTSFSVWHILQKVSLRRRSTPVLEGATWSPSHGSHWAIHSGKSNHWISPSMQITKHGPESTGKWGSDSYKMWAAQLPAYLNTDWNISCFPSLPDLAYLRLLLYISLHRLI